MNEEIRLLRDALEACIEVLPVLEGRMAEDAQKQARFALRVTSGRLPKGYEVVKWPMSWRITYQGNYLIVNRTHAGFDTELAARLFCWQHAQEQSEVAI